MFLLIKNMGSLLQDKAVDTVVFRLALIIRMNAAACNDRHDAGAAPPGLARRRLGRLAQRVIGVSDEQRQQGVPGLDVPVERAAHHAEVTCDGSQGQRCGTAGLQVLPGYALDVGEHLLAGELPGAWHVPTVEHQSRQRALLLTA